MSREKKMYFSNVPVILDLGEIDLEVFTENILNSTQNAYFAGQIKSVSAPKIQMPNLKHHKLTQISLSLKLFL